jgi:hypothetical protein
MCSLSADKSIEHNKKPLQYGGNAALPESVLSSAQRADPSTPEFALQSRLNSGSLAPCEKRSSSVYCLWLRFSVHALRTKNESSSIAC